MLVVDNISKKFGEKIAVDNLSFSLEPGQMIGILGHNGAGKTTTFRMILGILTPDLGVITYNGDQINYKNSYEIGFLTEERSLLQKYTIEDQLMYFARLKKMPKDKIKLEIEYWLNRFGLTEFKSKKIKELSKGNQQKIQFISTLIHKPNLIILDEPFSGLDPLNIMLFKDIILEQKKRGAIIIFSSHRLDYVQSFCENILVLVKGKPVINGNIDEIRKASNKFKIKINGELTIDDLKNIAVIDEIEVTNTHFSVSVDSYQKVREVYKALNHIPYIDMFYVDLPSLEEIIVSLLGGRNE